MQSSVPVIDLTPWLSGDETARAGVAAKVDAALQSVGFFLITGQVVPDELRARVRAEARGFFALPRDAKQRYASRSPAGAGCRLESRRTATPREPRLRRT